MPKISFIVPVYNTEKYLPICLNSVLNQTEQSIEVICINDASKDNSIQVLKYYENHYKGKMKVITLEENQGLSYARNLGLDAAQGEYIIYVDSDDIISLNMGENFIEVARRYKVPIVLGKMKKITESSYLENQNLVSNDALILSQISFNGEEGTNIFRQNVSVGAKAYHHDFIEHEYFKTGSIYEDVGYTYRLFFKGKEAVKINDFYYGYRTNPTGIMSKSRTISTDILDILDVCLDGKRYAEEYHLSEIEMNCFDDVLKRELLKKASWIQEWDISKQSQQFLIEKMLSVFNYYFPDIKTLTTTKGEKDATHILRKLDGYEYSNIETKKEVLAVEKRALRKIRSLQNDKRYSK